MTKTTTVREFSRCGPCIVLGKLVKETAHFYCYLEDRNNTGATRTVSYTHLTLPTNREV